MVLIRRPQRPDAGWLSRWSFEINSLSMTASVGIAGLLGVAYWAIAARLMSAEQVGQASAIISTMVTLGTIANLSLGPMLERFLPISGRRAGGYLVKAQLITAGFAVLLGVGFCLVGPVEDMFSEPWQPPVFVGFVVVQAAFALQDNVLTSLGVARWAAVKNTGHAALKIVTLLLVVVAAGGFALAASWVVVSALAVVVVLVVVQTRLPRLTAEFRDDLPPHRELWSYFASNYGIVVIASVPGLVIPLLVLSQRGAEQTAHFNLSWVLVAAFFTVLGAVVGPFVAEAAARPDEVLSLLRRFVRLVVPIAVAGGLFLAFLAPWLLHLVGKDYGTESVPLLRAMGLTVTLTAFTACYTVLAKVERKLALLVWVQVGSAILLVGLTALWVEPLGLAGIGLAYLVVQVLSCLVMVGPLIGSVRRFRAEAAARTEEPLEVSRQ